MFPSVLPLSRRELARAAVEANTLPHRRAGVRHVDVEVVVLELAVFILLVNIRRSPQIRTLTISIDTSPVLQVPGSVL